MKYTVLCWLAIAVPAFGADLATTPAKREVLPLERQFDGRVEAVHESTVSAETSGRVQELLFDVGDTVPAGAVILKLVSTEQRQGFSQAEAAVAEAKANLEVETRNYNRVREIYARQLVSKADFDRVTASYRSAEARLASAEAAQRAASERLSYTVVRAPYGGVVSARFVELGEAVQPGKPLMSGFDPDALRVEADLPQAVAEQVRALHRARVITGADTSVMPAKMALFPIADPATSTVRARLELPPQVAGLHPGQFVKVAFTVGEASRLLVPAASVVYRSEVSAVYVVDAQGVHLRQVRLGNRFGERVEVLAGLHDGEAVSSDPVAAGIVAVAAKAAARD